MIDFDNIFADLPEDPVFRALLESWAVEAATTQRRDWAVIRSLLARAVELGRRDWEALLRLFLRFSDLVPQWYDEIPPGGWGVVLDPAVEPIFGSREFDYFRSHFRTPEEFLECLWVLLGRVDDFLFVRSLPDLLGGKLETP